MCNHRKEKNPNQQTDQMTKMKKIHNSSNIELNQEEKSMPSENSEENVINDSNTSLSSSDDQKKQMSEMKPKKTKNRIGQRARKRQMENVLDKVSKKQKVTQPLPSVTQPKESKQQKVHPSWQAKQLAKSKQESAEFSGKRVVFD